MSVRVWSPDAGIQVRLKVEDAADPTKSVETEATTTVANAWETLTFDFANQAAGTAALNLAYTYNKISIFFNFGVTGAVAGAKTYYFDDVAFGGTPPPPPPPPTWDTITFDSSAVTYTLTGFGGAEDSTVVVDPTNAAPTTSPGSSSRRRPSCGPGPRCPLARTCRFRGCRSRPAAPRCRCGSGRLMPASRFG